MAPRSCARVAGLGVEAGLAVHGCRIAASTFARAERRDNSGVMAPAISIPGVLAARSPSQNDPRSASALLPKPRA